jgi:hypothetical protein
MWEHRQRAAGGDRQVLTRVWLSFLFRLSTDGGMELVPRRRLFRDQQQLLLVAEVA